MKKRITILDILIIVFFTSIIIIAIITYINNKKTSNPVLLVETPDDRYYYHLDDEKEITIEGTIGISTLTLGINTFKFTDSPCPHKLCVGMGTISRANYPAICLPNKVSAYIIHEKEESDFDGISR